MADTRPFITCHVLDTITGRPGPDIAVTLRLLSPAASTSSAANSDSPSWTARTNSDGRVTAWSGPSELNDAVAAAKSSLTASSDAKEEGYMLFSLTFATEAYFGKGKTFWPEVELRFAAKPTEAHYHVPLLLGPWSYTTYRGS